MGSVGADIAAVEIVEKRADSVIDDFMVELPQGVQPDALVSAVTALQGVEVLWLSYYSQAWGLHGDVQLLEKMTDNPEQASELLTNGAPEVFRSEWAVLLGRDGTVLYATELAPDLEPESIELLGPLNEADAFELPVDWVPGWGATLVARAPLRDLRSTLVIGRHGGPNYAVSELARLRHLTAMV
jgi:hypothetical protein